MFKLKNLKKNYNWLPVVNLDNQLLLSCVENVFKFNEVKELINVSENQGYIKAGLTSDKFKKQKVDEYVRKSDRVIIDSPELAELIENRIKHAIPKIYKGMKYDSINERFRFLKYDGEGHFNRHTDGHYQDQDKVSLITILIYLNQDYQGAYTTFFKDKYDKIGFALPPKTGMVCLMDQDIEHQVPELEKGVKYVVRSELMYKKN